MHPYTDPRFAFVSVLTSLPNGEATLDGTKKAVRLDAVDWYLNRFMPDRTPAPLRADEPDVPRGRSPRDTLTRDVEWFSRVKVKEPADTVAQILREAKAN